MIFSANGNLFIITFNLFVATFFLEQIVGFSDLEIDDASRLFKLYSPYSPVTIDDPVQNVNGSGLYLRISQRGVDYLADVASNSLPDIFHRLVLPIITESGLTLRDTVITRFDRPKIAVKFVNGHGIDMSIMLPELRLSGAADLSVFFASYSAQVVAIVSNLTIDMRVGIRKDLGDEETNVTVTGCSVNRSVLELKYFGAEASEFYAIGNMIQGGIDDAISGKICMLPPLIREFVQMHINVLMQPIDATTSFNEEKDPSSVLDHICAAPPIMTTQSGLENVNTDSSPEVDMQEFGNGTWVPDLTLRFPPTFSSNDLIFGIDGGILYNGRRAPDTIERPKFNHLSVRDQMIGAIISEYIPNTLFYHIYNNKLGQVSVTYSIKHIPRALRSLAQVVCSDCKLVVTANLTKVPISSIDRNGIVLLLEGDIAATFKRKNQSYNIVTARGLIRVAIKPHFRHSRLYSDVLLAGVDFKVYKASMSGFISGAVKKVISFLIPHAIWPKIQQRLRLAVNYKGIQIPRICTVEFTHLHLDYMKHAAIISSDFDVDQSLLVRSFKQFMDNKVRKVRTRKELRREFRYL